MKYQKLEDKADWKWKYLIKKYREGENITRYEERSLQKNIVEKLFTCHNKPALIETWVESHMSPNLKVKLDQAIRARRKRF